MDEKANGMEAALRYIGDLKDETHKNDGPTVIPMPHEPPGTYGLWNPANKQLEIKLGATPPRQYEAGSVEAVVKLIDELGAADKQAFVFVKEGRIETILDERGDRRERVRMRLTPATAFTALRANNGWLGQKAMIEFLRTNLNAKYDPASLLTTVRALKFDSTTSGESTVRTGRESMGKNVSARVAGLTGEDMEDMENVTVTLPVYVDLLDASKSYELAEFSVGCSFDIDVQEAKFRLRPKAGEIERALLEADRRIMDDITANVKDATRVRVFCGVPN